MTTDYKIVGRTAESLLVANTYGTVTVEEEYASLMNMKEKATAGIAQHTGTEYYGLVAELAEHDLAYLNRKSKELDTVVKEYLEYEEDSEYESRRCEIGRECVDGCDCDRAMRRWRAEEF